MAGIEKVYFMRVALGVIAGLVSGFIIKPEFGPSMSALVAIGIAILFFAVSIGVSRGLSRGQPKELRKKAGYDGIVPFIFMNIVFMIIVYTALYQHSILK